jgi:hypothetical protein
MDRSHVITAVIAAVATLMIGGVGKWLFAVFDAIIPISKAPEKVKNVFSIKGSRGLFWSILYFLLVASGAVSFMFEKSPITRWTIIEGGVFILGLLGSVMQVMWYSFSILHRRRSANRPPNSD